MNNPFAIFKETNSSHWGDAGLWLAYNLIGSLAPLWLGYFILKSFSRDPTLAGFSQHGEFAIYTAAMIASAFYTANRVALPGFNLRQIFVLMSFVLILLAIGSFVAVSTAFMDPTSLLTINQDFVRRVTITSFLISVVLAFFVTVLDNARLTPDPVNIVNSQQKKLSDEFDNLGENNG
jgi:hypothetical protein